MFAIRSFFDISFAIVIMYALRQYLCCSLHIIHFSWCHFLARARLLLITDVKSTKCPNYSKLCCDDHMSVTCVNFYVKLLKGRNPLLTFTHTCSRARPQLRIPINVMTVLGFFARMTHFVSVLITQRTLGSFLKR